MKGKVNAIIIHISDLHFGEKLESSKKKLKFKHKLIEKIVKYGKGIFSLDINVNPHDINLCHELALTIKKICEKKLPTFLVVSGDLTTLGDEESFGEVRSYLHREYSFQNPGLGFEANNQIIVPGNHDTIFNKYYEEKEDRLEYYKTVFEQPLPYSKHVSVDGLKFTFFAFDSTKKNYFFFSDGEIGDGLSWFKKECFRLKGEYGQDYLESIKVVVFHHHPIPLPGATPSIWTQLIDGSKFVPILHDEGIDLVMHGHEHFMAASRIQYLYGDSENKPVNICAAGTATQENKNLRNGFNVYYFSETGAFLEPWEYDKRRSAFFPLQSKIKLF